MAVVEAAMAISEKLWTFSWQCWWHNINLQSIWLPKPVSNSKPTLIAIPLHFWSQSCSGCHMQSLPGPTPWMGQCWHCHPAIEGGLGGWQNQYTNTPNSGSTLHPNPTSPFCSHCHWPCNLLFLAKLSSSFGWAACQWPQPGYPHPLAGLPFLGLLSYSLSQWL